MGMTQTSTTAESEARDFAAQFNTPNVRAAIAYAEAGTVTWEQIRDLFAKSLTTGLNR